MDKDKELSHFLESYHNTLKFLFSKKMFQEKTFDDRSNARSILAPSEGMDKSSHAPGLPTPVKYNRAVLGFRSPRKSPGTHLLKVGN